MRAALRPVTTSTVAAAMVFALAACGGDDDGGDAAEPATDAPAPSGDGDADVGHDGAEDAAADAPAGGDGPALGEPSSFLADELHPLELPEPGTAVVRLAGETYVFDDLQECRISDALAGRLSFRAVGNSELADGSGTRVEISRQVVDVEETGSAWHERDYLQVTVEQEPGGEMYSNAWHDTTRDEPGGPVSGDGDVLPVVRVVDDGGVVAATAIAEVSHPPFTGDFDRTGEGLAEFAVNCG